MTTVKRRVWTPSWSPDQEAEVEALAAGLRRRVQTLRSLRDALGLTQVDVAEIMGATQSSVSKLEGKDDIRLSVLRRVVEHQGGKLRIVAEMKDRQIELSF